MHKVMTRAQNRPGTRPPSRRDPRRPGGTPPRAPGSGTLSTTPGDGRPPGRATALHTRPADTRPPASPNATTPRSLPTAPRTTGTASGTPTTSRATGITPRQAPTTARSGTGTTPRPTSPAAAPVVPAQTPRRPIPQPRPTDLFAERLLAVLSGQRPVHAMLRHTVGRAYDELAWLAERGPLRTTRGTRPVVRDIGYFMPCPGAIEAFARIGAGDRLRAMAFRLELGQDLRWRCTAVELGGPRPPHTNVD
ncbi:Rv3235 family protein [Streptomyces sp. TRM68367]|uniref:Rv3235 family protein n=1 Tax=Streptomyces sp. TRM68367 TaxID=2758415 RepID=UPI00165BEB36|nr:Rv3235 family protein [Streptomyces sp. TRM68367]MBC9725478.1 hypothetical protein [Streptomyces sp. TRM68367]